MTYNAKRRLQKSANRVFEMLRDDIIKPNIGNEYMLSEIECIKPWKVELQKVQLF